MVEIGVALKNIVLPTYISRFGWIYFACLSYELRLCEDRTVKDFGVSVRFRKQCEGETVCQSKLTPTFDGLMTKISRFQAPHANQCKRLSKFSLSQFYCAQQNKRQKMPKLSFNCLCMWHSAAE